MASSRSACCVLGMLMVVLMASLSTTEGHFDETLTVYPLADNGRVAMLFNFTLEWDSDETGQHFGLCPKTLCSLIASQNIYQLNLAMTKGRWNYEKWGNSPLPAPQGAELTVYYEGMLSPEEVDAQWQATTNILAGQFCASLEYMYRPPVATERAFSTHPITPFKVAAQTSTEEKNVRLYKTGMEYPFIGMRHSILHGETVCTENLTPWMKLLPCRSESGLAKYLSNPSFLFNFDYVSLGVSVLPTTPKTLQMTLMLVADRNLPPVPASISTFQPPPRSPVFDLRALLGVKLTGSQHKCPLARSSTLILRQHKEKGPGPDVVETPCGNEVCDLRALDSPWNVIMKWNEDRTVEVPEEFRGFVTAHRWTVGYGHQNGKLALELTNRLSRNVTISYRQVTPFMLRLMFHTLTATGSHIQDGKRGAKNDSTLTWPVQPTSFKVEPGLDRLTMTSMQLGFELPAKSKVLVTIDYDLVFLHWTEHPPDAHRGFDISAGIMLVTVDPASLLDLAKAMSFGALPPTTTLTVSERSKSDVIEKFHFLVYTEGLVLSLPTPDFSMPYNVITLTSTVLAIIFAFTVKTLTRRYGLLFKDGAFASDRAIVLIIRKIASFFKKPQAQPQDKPQVAEAQAKE